MATINSVVLKDFDYHGDGSYLVPSVQLNDANDNLTANIIFSDQGIEIKNNTGDYIPLKVDAINAVTGGSINGKTIYSEDGSPLLVHDGGNGANDQPSVTAGVGIGTGYTTSLDGNDAVGLIQFTTGTSPTPDAEIVTITYGRPFTDGNGDPDSRVYVFVQPLNAASQALFQGADFLVVCQSSTEWKLKGSAAASTDYVFAYHVVQRVGA